MPPAAEPLVSVVPPWRHVQGHLYGLPQPGLAGQLAIRSFSPDQLQQVDQRLSAQLGDLPPGLLGDRTVTGLARRFVHAVTACQRAAGIVVAETSHVQEPVARPRGGHRCQVVMACPQRQAAQTALPFVLALFNRRPNDPSDGPAHTEAAHAVGAALRRFAEQGHNLSHLLRAALALDLPCTAIAPHTYRFGHGCRQQVLRSTATERTPVVGVSLARDKKATAALLRRHALPCAEHRSVTDAEQAVVVARQLGYPVVIKPNDRDGGQGVWADVRDDDTVRAAYAEASRHSSHVLVERHGAGTGHRLTVVMGRVVKVTAKRPWGVMGDGLRSVEQLVHAQRAARPHGPAPDAAPSIDPEALGLLAQQGLGLHAVPADGRFVPLRRRNNANCGGTTQRLDLAQVHPDNIDLALRAAQALMLDVAGIDLIVPDIGRSWMAQEALVCDVNAVPQTDLGTVTEMLSRLMRDGARVPVWLLLVPDAAAAPSETQVLHLMQACGADGLSSRWGVWLSGRRTAPPQATGFQAAEALLSSRELTRAAIVMDLDELARDGLPVDRFDRVCAGLDMQHLLDAVALPFNPAHTGTLRDTLAHAAAGWPRRDRDRLLALAVPLSPHATQHRRPKPAGPTAPFAAT